MKKNGLLIFISLHLCFLCNGQNENTPLVEESSKIVAPTGIAVPSGKRGEPVLRSKIVIPKVDAKRLSFSEEGVALFPIKYEIKTANGWEEFEKLKPFRGTALWEGDNWKASVSYVDGLPDGEAVVYVDNLLFCKFRYAKGIKVFDIEGRYENGVRINNKESTTKESR